MDGALSNNMPLFEHTNTITMAPFSGESDISPREEAFNPVMVHCCNLSIQVNTRNIHRICTSFLPPTLEVAPPAGSLYLKTCNWVHLLKASVTLSFSILLELEFFAVVFLWYGAKLKLSWCFPEEFNTDLITNRSLTEPGWDLPQWLHGCSPFPKRSWWVLPPLFSISSAAYMGSHVGGLSRTDLIGLQPCRPLSLAVEKNAIRPCCGQKPHRRDHSWLDPKVIENLPLSFQKGEEDMVMNQRDCDDLWTMTWLFVCGSAVYGV